MNLRVNRIFGRKKILLAILVSLLVIVNVTWWRNYESGSTAVEVDDFLPFTFFTDNSERQGRTIQSLVHLPPSYDSDGPSKEWPLVLFLHGSWNRGSDLDLVRKSGLPKIIEEGGSHPYIMVAPQCPAEENWQTEDIFQLLDEVEKKFRVDKDRIHVTGFESGGDASWNLAALNPERFATAVPFGGSPEGEKRASPEWMSRVHLWYLSSETEKNYPPINHSISKAWDSGSYVRKSKILAKNKPFWQACTQSYKLAGITTWMLERQKKSHFVIRWKDDPPQPGRQVWGELCEQQNGEIEEPLIGFWIYQPEATDGAMPLLMFLHGSEHAGDDPQQVLKASLPRVIENGTTPPFLVVSPHCPGKSKWDLPLLEILLEQLDEELAINPRRLFLTGVGEGAGAAWNLADRDPWRFAGVAPIGYSPGPLHQQQAHHMRRVPKSFFSNEPSIKPAILYYSKSASLLQGSSPFWTVSHNESLDSLATRVYSSGEIFDWFSKLGITQWNVQRDFWLGNSWDGHQQMASPKVVALFKKHKYFPKGDRAEQEPFVYRLHAPPILKAGETYPLIIWLHGHGKQELLLEAGELKYADLVFQDPADLQSREFFMLAIQCPAERSWAGGRGDDEPIAVLMEILRGIRQDQPVDKKRISLVGISSGANACWELLRRHPKYFSAIAPLGSHGGALFGLQDMSGERLWVFKGLLDDNVREIGNTVRRARSRGAEVRFTEILMAGHHCWNEAFLDHNLLSWLLAQQRD